MIVIVMGVTGCGKTTLGRALGETLNLPMHDADDYHPEANRVKLRANIPLGDDDRWPWLAILARNIAEWEGAGGAVLACSALKKSYREILRSGSPGAVFVYLKGDRALIAERLAQRTREGHDLIRDFGQILDGQFRDLEEPQCAIVVSVELPVAEAARVVCEQLTEKHLW